MSRDSGIVTYLATDIELAAALECAWPRSWITAAVRAIGAGGKEALPGRVQAGLDQAALEMGMSAARDCKYAQQVSRMDSSPASDLTSPAVRAALEQARRVKVGSPVLTA